MQKNLIPPLVTICFKMAQNCLQFTSTLYTWHSIYATVWNLGNSAPVDLIEKLRPLYYVHRPHSASTEPYSSSIGETFVK